jgi:hypothetical protein
MATGIRIHPQETDRKILFKRIEVAETAFLARREILMRSPDGFAKRQETKLALAKARNLKKQVLKFLSARQGRCLTQSLLAAQSARRCPFDWKEVRAWLSSPM